MIISVKAPVRVDFAGAWTDVKYFAHAFGGATTNAAINYYVNGQTVHGSHTSADGAMATEGISVTYETTIPAGSGLGTSSALNVVWLALASGKQQQSKTWRSQVAEQAHQVETVLGILGGKQDQYAAAHGGFHLYEFHEDDVKVHPVQISTERIKELESLCTLCYTGQARFSSTLHENVWGGFKAGKRQVVDALFALRDSAYQAKVLLEAGNWEEFGSLLHQQHHCAKNLDDSLSNSRVEDIIQLTAPFTIGSKCCGAGGGGCMLFLSPTSKHQQQCAAILKEHNIQVIPFQFAMDGLTVEKRE